MAAVDALVAAGDMAGLQALGKFESFHFQGFSSFFGVILWMSYRPNLNFFNLNVFFHTMDALTVAGFRRVVCRDSLCIPCIHASWS